MHSEKATQLFFAKTDLSPMESLNQSLRSRPSIAEAGHGPQVGYATTNQIYFGDGMEIDEEE